MNWNKLQTIAQFDGTGDIIQSFDKNSLNLNDENHFFNNTITQDALSSSSASTSLLIESLIQLLCLILEDDQKLAQKSYLSICEQLNKINLIDNSYSLNEFEDIRSQYQMQIYKIICAVRGQDIPIQLPNNNNINNGAIRSQSVETCWSRYHREFEELNFIAGGGFGKVFRARHKLDCIEYAVKQIKIHSTTIKLCHLAEVKTIASLNHPNIVQYKAAWLEPYLPKNNNNKKTINTSSSTDSNDLKIKEIEAITTTNTATPTYDDNNSGECDVITEKSLCKLSKTTINDQSSDFIQFERSNNNDDDGNESDNSNYNNKVICKYSSNNNRQSATSNISTETDEKSVILDVAEIDHKNFYSSSKPKLAILYIQMSLCQLTLRKWLNERNSHSTFEEYYLEFFSNFNIGNNSNNNQRQDINHLDIVNDLFCQILSGLNYIHSRNIVHHDIKPSNIFLGIDNNDGKLIAQLGDFGLSCPLQSAHHGIALGTPLYAAPEQLKGQCNPKSDIYSLGIVLLELLIKFNTDMERVRTIENARKGILPIELSKQSTKLLRSLLSHEKKRPTTKELLEAIRVINLEQNLRALRVSQNDSKNKDNKIYELNEELKLSQDEIKCLLSEIHNKDKKIDELEKLLKEKDKEIKKFKKIIAAKNNLKIKII